MSKGGFDVVIGNPPYKDLPMVVEYRVRGFASAATKNLYPIVMERSLQLSRHNGRLGFIVPVSSISTEGYKVLQELVFRYSGHFSSFDDRPSRLFEGLQHIRLTIHLIQHSDSNSPTLNVTECYRWNATERDFLFGRLSYKKVERNYLLGCLPKLSRPVEYAVLEKIWNDGRTIGEQMNRGSHEIYYSRKMANFLQALDFVPAVYDGTGNLRSPTELKELNFQTSHQAALALCLLNSSLFRWYINVFSDVRHVNRREVEGFRLDLAGALDGRDAMWVQLAGKLSRRLKDTSEFRSMRFKHDHLRVQCIIPKLSKPIIDQIDRLLAEHYGFTDEELDFIINYDIKYRMGREG